MGFKIIIEEKSYPIKFGYGAFRALAEELDCKGVTGVLSQIGELFENFENLDFKQEAFFAEMIKAGMKSANDSIKDMPSTDDVLTAFLFNPVNQEQVMQAVFKAMPNPEGNQKPQKAAGQK